MFNKRSPLIALQANNYLTSGKIFWGICSFMAFITQLHRHFQKGIQLMLKMSMDVIAWTSRDSRLLLQHSDALELVPLL